MEAFFVKCVSRGQAYFLTRAESGRMRWWNRVGLWLLTMLDTYLYQKDRVHYGEIRRRELGNIFCGMGRVICLDYSFAWDKIGVAQQRGGYIGRMGFSTQWFPKYFLLFLDDPPFGNHHLYHNHVVRFLFHSHTRQRLEDDYTQELIGELVAQTLLHPSLSSQNKSPLRINGMCQVDFGIEGVEKALMGLLLYVFLGLQTNIEEREGFYHLASVNTKRYLRSRLSGGREGGEEIWIEKIMGSPVLHTYQPPQEDACLDKREMAELVLAVLVIAGYLGTISTLLGALSIEIHGKGLEFKGLEGYQGNYRSYILETIRRFGPVNLVNTELGRETTILIEGKEHLFPPSTILSYSLLGAGFDNSIYSNPYQFQPERQGLSESMVNFNHRGLGKEEKDLLHNRGCPARFLVVDLLGKILRAF